MLTLAIWSLVPSPFPALIKATGAAEPSPVNAASPVTASASEEDKIRISWNPSLRWGCALNAASFAANLKTH
jgi:hypothetical protein